MHDVYAEFERELEGYRTRFKGQPREEMIQLFLLALEREQLVAIGYREDIIARRLAGLPIDEATREVILHALTWACRDEEIHAVYIRGALLKLGSPALRVRSFAQQLAGWVGGWTSSTTQHLTFREAPL